MFHEREDPVTQEQSRDVLIFRYARMAMEFTLSPSRERYEQLEELRAKIGMTSLEIMRKVYETAVQHLRPH